MWITSLQLRVEIVESAVGRVGFVFCFGGGGGEEEGGGVNTVYMSQYIPSLYGSAYKPQINIGLRSKVTC